MKRKTAVILCLFLLVWMSALPAAGQETAQEGRTMHQFLGLPFETATPHDVEAALLEAYGVSWIPNHEFYLSDGITVFGHEFSFGIEFNPDQVGFVRLYLSPAHRNIWSGETEEFTQMLRRDIADFMLLDNLISEQYGPPDVRCFRTGGEKYNAQGTVVAMFSGGEWDADRLMELFRTDNGNLVYAVWGNVELQYWVIWRDAGPKKSKSCITLYYHDIPWFPGVTPDTLLVYPPADSN